MDTLWTLYGHFMDTLWTLVLFCTRICTSQEKLRHQMRKRKQSGRKFHARLLIITIAHSKKEYNGGSVEDL